MREPKSETWYAWKVVGADKRLLIPQSDPTLWEGAADGFSFTREEAEEYRENYQDEALPEGPWILTVELIAEVPEDPPFRVDAEGPFAGLVACEKYILISDDDGNFVRDEEGEPVYKHVGRFPASYLTVYAVTRHYGGPEEGGWYYDHWDVVVSLPLVEQGDIRELELLRAVLRPRYPDQGNIGSVRGGVEYHFEAEAVQGGHRTLVKPRYS